MSYGNAIIKFSGWIACAALLCGWCVQSRQKVDSPNIVKLEAKAASVQIKAGTLFNVPLTDGTTAPARCENVNGEARMTIIVGSQFLDLKITAWGNRPVPSPIPGPVPTPTPTPTPTPIPLPTPPVVDPKAVSIVEVIQDNCPPCVAQAPVTASCVAAGIPIATVNSATADGAKWNAAACPTFVMLVGGAEVSRQAGTLTQSQITIWVSDTKAWANQYKGVAIP